MNRIDVVAARLRLDADIDDWKRALSELSGAMGWSSGDGRPFAAVISSTDRVLLKPNWVMDQNKGPWGLEPLITSPALVIAAAELALECGPREVALGDAPLQGCRIEKVWENGGIAEWAHAARSRGLPVRGPLDFRRTVARLTGGVLDQATNRRALEAYRLVNLGSDSLLEPITTERPTFRVTQYPPALMVDRHAPGHHQYLLAADVLQATVVINLPKLKTHKKAGVTSALKNLVGINGNKEFLPHHRLGSPADGGDCYPRPNPFKRMQERLYDVQNGIRSLAVRKLLRYPIGVVSLLSRYHRERFGLEGAWSGNDTVWRMSVDLNRALLYADEDGVMRDTQQRRELHIVDAVIAGQGDGPLASEPFELGFVLASNEAPAADWVGAQLLGYDPARIPIVSGSFGSFRFPISSGPTSAVSLRGVDGRTVDLASLPLPTRYPEGWIDCVRPHESARQIVGTTFGSRHQVIVESQPT